LLEGSGKDAVSVFYLRVGLIFVVVLVVRNQGWEISDGALGKTTGFKSPCVPFFSDFIPTAGTTPS
jgi:hypothetical protein